MNVKQLEIALENVIKKMIQGNFAQDRETYINFLAQTYYFVCHSVPLLKMAIKNTSNEEFIERSLEHIKEENGHEMIALRDLKRLGANIQDYPEWKWTKDFYGKQYELVAENGEILLGYILALEGIAALSKEAAASVEKSFEKGSKFVKIHVEEDQEHLAKVLKQIKRSCVQKEIIDNFFDTVSKYESFVDQLATVQLKAA
ncbi:MAG: iron-containing redox enzyme family protein [Bacteriovoracaceae bacterium]|nr:iron-containing redox enzyme family protein [Bacteriovoracaceae bacterium]